MANKKDSVTILYTAYLHKSAMVFIKCDTCGFIHKPHPEGKEDPTCENCKLIVKHNIAEMETNLHQEEIQKSMRGEVVECKHESLPFDMNN